MRQVVNGCPIFNSTQDAGLSIRPLNYPNLAPYCGSIRGKGRDNNLPRYGEQKARPETIDSKWCVGQDSTLS